MPPLFLSSFLFHFFSFFYYYVEHDQSTTCCTSISFCYFGGGWQWSRALLRAISVLALVGRLGLSFEVAIKTLSIFSSSLLFIYFLHWYEPLYKRHVVLWAPCFMSHESAIRAMMRCWLARVRTTDWICRMPWLLQNIIGHQHGPKPLWIVPVLVLV